MVKNDQALMAAVSRNDNRAVELLYDRFRTIIAHMAYEAGLEVEDTLQAVMVKLWQTAGRYDQKRANLITWVVLITRRTITDALRCKRNRIKPGRLEMDSGDTVTMPVYDPEPVEDQFDRWMPSLPHLQQEILTLNKGRGIALRCIATHLGVPEGTIKSGLARALNFHRQRLA